MRGSLLLKAQLSWAIYGSKGSFEKELNSLPTTAFQYYYRSKLKELLKSSNSFRHEGTVSCGQQSNTFRRFIRKEWDLLSTSKKRIYYAFFFHFTRTDYKSLNKYELAKILEIPTPAISEYMLFRNKFKHKYDTVCFQERTERQRKRGIMVTHNSTAKNHLVTVSSRAIIPKEEHFNLTKRFQKMCRECRHVWNKKISSEQKDEIRSKWEDQKRQFDLVLTRELEVLAGNLSRLLKMNVDAQIKSLQIDRHQISTITSDIIIPFAFPKKK